MAREIELTHGFVAIVDDADYEWLSQVKWSALLEKNASKPRAACTSLRVGGKWRMILMHREIMRPPATMCIDHIDGNPLNNTRKNLRICTTAQNARNRGKTVNNTSGYKGVCFSKYFGTWHAQIGVDGKTIDLGMFPTAIEAAWFYDKAAKKYHGEFARLNFPEAVRA